MIHCNLSAVMTSGQQFCWKGCDTAHLACMTLAGDCGHHFHIHCIMRLGYKDIILVLTRSRTCPDICATSLQLCANVHMSIHIRDTGL